VKEREEMIYKLKFYSRVKDYAEEFLKIKVKL